MVNVLIRTESHYTVDRKRVRDRIEKILSDRKIKVKTEVSVSIVGDRLMKRLNNQYRHIDETTDVLSFPTTDTEDKTPFIDVPDGILRLGDIVISYPQAWEDAREENKLVDDKMDELIEHGLLHLLGYHHE